MEIEIIPDLVNCVQTKAKREYERVLGRLLREDGEDPHLEERLEVLRVFLETADFKSLRGRSEKVLLDGGTVSFKIGPKGWRMEIGVTPE